MGFWVTVAVYVGLYIINKYVLAKPPEGNKDRRTQDDSPTVRDGVSIPIWYGKCRFEAPNLVWNSPRIVMPTNGNGIDVWGSNMLFVLGIPGGVLSAHPPTYLRKVTWDDFEINGTRYVSNSGLGPPFYSETVPLVNYDMSTTVENLGIFRLNIDDPANGVFGTVIVRDGFYGLGPYGCGEFAYATGQAPEMWPGYRNQTTMLMVGFGGVRTIAAMGIAGNLRGTHFAFGPAAGPPDLPSAIITMTNPCPLDMGGGHPEILPVDGANPNPIAVLYDILTNDWSRVGLSPAKIDLASFSTAAATLENEFHAWGGFLVDPAAASDVIRELLAQINGVLYEDVQTRLLKIKLIRFDYTVGSLPLFDTSNVAEVVQFMTSTFGDSYNQVRVTYTDASDGFGTRTAVAQDLANITSQGGRVRSTTIDFPHIRSAATAAQVAARELNEVSLPLASLKIRVNRDGFLRRPGDAFRFTWPRLNMTDVVFRVQHVDYGQLGTEDIIIDAIQDVFNLDFASVGVPTVPFPNAVVLPIQERVLTEVPRYIAQFSVFSGFNSTADDPRLFYLAVPPQPESTGYTIYEYDDDFVRTVADLIFAPHPYPVRAVVASSYSRALDPYDTSTGLLIAGVSDTVVLRNITDNDVGNGGQNLMLVGDEFMAYETFTDLGGGSYRLNNVWRGLFDTPCVAHAAGERIYFLSDALGITAERYTGRFARSTAGTTCNARFLSHVAGIGQNPDDYGVETDRLVARNRQALPLSPADLVVEGGKGATLKSEGFFATWKERNRLNVNVVRGDAAAEDGGAVQHRVKVQKIGPLQLTGPLTQVDVAPNFGDAGAATTTTAGHGDIDVVIAAFDTSTSLEAWDPVRVTMTCPPWRQLLANSSFDDPLNTYTPEWVIVTGGDRDDDSAHVHGDSPFYLTADAVNENIDVSQTVDITGYHAERMTANVTWFAKQTSASGDLMTVTLSALDSGGSTLTSTTLGPATPTTQWVRYSLTIANLPASTTKVKVRVQGDHTEDAVTTLVFADFTLRVGQMSSQLILNGDFESGGGSLTSWTTVSGSWSAVTTAGYNGNSVATNDSTGTNELRQDVTMPAGFEYGTAVVAWAQRDADTADSDTGQVILEARNGGGSVVASASSTALEATPLGFFVPRQLELDNLPADTATIRVRVIAVANTIADVMFDAFELRVHKHLDPDQRLDGDMRAPTHQARPLDRGDWVEAFPTVPMPDYGMYTHGNLVSSAFRGRLGIEPPLNAPSGARVGKFTGFYDSEAGKFVFGPVTELQSTDVGLVSGDKNLYGNFSATESFSVLAIFRNRLTAVAACGLVGRIEANVDNVGWSLELTSSGFVQARLEGSTATATATRGTAVKDGHPWMAWLIYDHVAQQLHCVDPSGTTTVSTASIGEFKSTAPAPFTIGRSEESQTCLDGQIDVHLWRQAITTSQAASIWDHGESPTEAVTASARTGTVVMPVDFDSDGEVLASFHQTQLPIGRENGTSSSIGVAMNIAMTSLITASNFRDTTAWPRDGGATVTVDRQAPLGFLDGMSITGTNAAGVRSANFTLSATVTVKVVFWARTTGSIHDARLELRNSSGVVKGTLDFTVGPDWVRYDHTFTTWDASTASGQIKFYGSVTGSSNQVEIAGPVYVSQSTFVPMSVPYGGAVAASELAFSASALTHFNSEGEIYVQTHGKENAPGVQRDIVIVDNGSNNNDARTVRYNSSSNAQLIHNDGTATGNTATASGTGWDIPRTIRGRWNRAGLIEAAATFSAINRDGVSTTGRSAIWTPSTTGPARVRLLASNLLIPRFVLSAREINLSQLLP